MKIDFSELQKLIEKRLLEYVGIRSDTNSAKERNIEAFYKKWFQEVPYLKENPDYCGLFKIPGDYLDRHVAWCLRKGEGDKTIILMHHYDCVETLDYANLEDVCLKPYELKEAFRKQLSLLPDRIAQEIGSDDWIVGRGVCDMKGGGAIELALIEKYCEEKNFKGNVLLIAVPDEENLSAGMLGANLLLKELKVKWNLDYRMMVDTEPHERDNPDISTLYDGSIGKIMPVVYVRGKLAHVGQIYSGLNPINLLAEIIRRTDLNPIFIERSGNTVTPAGTWLYCKDRKEVYDVSLPIDATGYMSILPLEKTAKELMDIIKTICTESFDHVLEDMNKSYSAFLAESGLENKKLPFKTDVKFFSELYQEAVKDSGDAFVKAYKETYESIKTDLIAKKTTMIAGVNALIAITLKHVADPSPKVVIALAPPFYPSVNNAKLSGEVARKADQAIAGLVKYAKEEFNQTYEVKNYFTGISDLSYAMFDVSDDNIAYIENNMLLWGDVYKIPLDVIKELSMPVVNIGPWGQDFHKYTERVLADDLYRVTPNLVHKMVCEILKD